MEQSGRKQWQPLADAPVPKTGKQAKTVAVGCDRLPREVHGKEGVSGSSPEEGLKKALQMGM